jgi:hypothetical protein
MRILPLLPAILLAACAGANPRAPYAVIDGSEWTRTDPYSFPVRIASIDGRDYLRLDRRVVEPGRHVLRFESTKPMRKGRQYRDTRELTVELKPCTHYYFAAKHASEFSEIWEVKLVDEQTIPDCG